MQLETLLDLVERMRIAQKTAQALGPKFNHPKLKELEEQVDAELARIRRETPDDSSEASSSKSDEPQAPEPQAREPEPKASEPEPTAASKRGRGFDKRRSQSDNLAPATMGALHRRSSPFAAAHPWKRTRRGFRRRHHGDRRRGRRRSRLIGINHCALRLESEVELIARAAEGNGQATAKDATDKPSRGNVAAE
ncbi:MAG: hypothetical protein R3C99_08440 [Pirellulaceae bacterium]